MKEREGMCGLLQEAPEVRNALGTKVMLQTSKTFGASFKT